MKTNRFYRLMFVRLFKLHKDYLKKVERLRKNLILKFQNRFNQWSNSMNSFKDIQAAREEMLPPDVEHRLMHQVESYVHIGRIADLYVPAALNACVSMISGGVVIKDHQSPETKFDWRQKQF